ncbi:hypothetical protein IFR23_02465 [Sphingomonas sp. CFBP 13603]|uniref:hypothetical protein n=1 Tax=Sphingomonas sp. CFBP 13603 TaxID=2774040 RepID=UPI0018669C61|nr:hypothetical protein [Sphingomonas sp. CFBP 13603]MBE2990871.1 hypothetical protein [Sphingomonas sp. CFBP 13603]
MSEDQDALVEGVASAAEAKRTCGIIIPISATANHSEAHWSSVRVLLSRAIEKAGFVAAPVWENSSADRVSERIIGNIFHFPLVVADISDSNPNVMLELGLRLASKKPTVVIVNVGGTIPFDIRDFHALQYPPSLSILEMESFIEELSATLIAKDEASRKEGYIPFLGQVVVDVVQPGEREVPIQQYVLDRLDEISAKINRPAPPLRSSLVGTQRMEFTKRVTNSIGTAYFFTLDNDYRPQISEQLIRLAIDAKVHHVGDGVDGSYYAIVFPEITGDTFADHFGQRVEELISPFGGRLGVPTAVAKKAAVF